VSDKLIYCRVCQDLIAESELKRWSGDDALHFLCPGCDSDLLPVRNPDKEYDEWLASQKPKEFPRQCGFHDVEYGVLLTSPSNS
jgi:hypothetical protein